MGREMELIHAGVCCGSIVQGLAHSGGRAAALRFTLSSSPTVFTGEKMKIFAEF